jgi:hypothetical protein
MEPYTKHQALLEPCKKAQPKLVGMAVVYLRL